MTLFWSRLLLVLPLAVLAGLSSARADNVLHIYAAGINVYPVPGTYTGNPSSITVDETFRSSDGWDFAVTTPWGPSEIDYLVTRADLSQAGYYGQTGTFTAINTGTPGVPTPALAVGDYPSGAYASVILNGLSPDKSDMQVLDIAYDPDTGAVTRLAVDFTISQPNVPGRVAYGQFRYNSDVPLDAGRTYVEFDRPTVTGTEGDGQIPITVARRGGSADAVSVRYKISGGTATRGVDYTPVSGTLSWAAGDTSPRTILLPVIQNSVVDGPRNVRLKLIGDNLGPTTRATVTITDDDPLPPSLLHYRLYGFMAQDDTFTSAEGYTFTGLPVEPSGTDITVVGPASDYSYTWLTFSKHGRLEVGDFEAAGGSGFYFSEVSSQTGDIEEWQILQANYGTDGKLLQLAVNFDEKDASGQLVLRGEVRYHSTVALRGTVEFTSGTFQGKKSAAGIVMTVKREGDPSDAATVGYGTTDYSALGNVDYTPTQGTLTWAAGDTGSRSFTVPVLHDAAAGNRLFFVNLAGDSLGVNETAAVTIVDDSLPAVASLPEPDGLVDTNYGVLFGNPSEVVIGAIAPLADGRALIGGNFTAVSGQPQVGLLRLDAAGVPDFTFPSPLTANAAPQVDAIVVQPDGKLLVAGSFALGAGPATTSVARLNADGSLDKNFQAAAQLGANALVYRLALQPDGRILLAGRFAVGSGLARLNADGSLDTGFTAPTVDYYIEYNFVLLQPDGKILMGNDYGAVKRLNPDGSVDPTFTSYANSAFGSRAVALQPDGKLLLTTGTEGYDITRLDRDGTVDNTFALPLGVTTQIEYINSLVLQPDGKLLVGFTPQAFSAAQGSIGVMRLNADGSQDSSFTLAAGTTGSVGALALEPDGGLLLSAGYSSTAKSGVIHTLFARLAGVAPDTTLPIVTIATETSPAVKTTGQAGELMLTRTGNISGPLVVEYTVRGRAGAGTDYVALSGRAKFKHGHNTTTINIQPLAGAPGRGALKVKVALVAKDAYTVGASGAATIKIVDGP